MRLGHRLWTVIDRWTRRLDDRYQGPFLNSAPMRGLFWGVKKLAKSPPIYDPQSPNSYASMPWPPLLFPVTTQARRARVS